MKNISFVVRSSLPVVSAVLLLSGVLSGCASKYPAPVDDRSQSSSTAAAKDTYVVKPGDTLYSIARAHGLDHRELIALNNIENANQISVGRVLKVKPKSADTSSDASVTPVTSGEVVSRPIGDEQVEQKPLDGGGAGANTETLKREPKAGKEKYSDEALARAQSTSQIAPATAGAAASASQGEAPPPEAKVAEPAAGGDDVGWIWPANGKTIGTFSEGGSKGVDIAGKAGDPVIAAGDGKVVYSGTGLRGYGKLVIIKHNNTYLSAYAHNQNILVKEGQSVTKGQKIAEMGNTDADQVKLHFEVRRSGKPVDPLKYLPQR